MSKVVMKRSCKRYINMRTRGYPSKHEETLVERMKAGVHAAIIEHNDKAT